ncbi:phenylalanine--tRNA ligase subunit beta [Brevundimonas sp. 2R-24]|uniref:Phenylalanine--tRNA ligase beta subunit n=1 Tax=Peiella sedimenti TaxID=3061083 RepID=A0ABT8SGV7_9CAUL|nr:phenylalanine--tRNA ligase subunit beta [Caulobacteraceae bacterium XZ-24]
MKFTLSWLKEHLETDADVSAVADAMTMAGLEVEHVADPASRLKPFSVARIVEAARHPNADRLQVCQVETVDGMKEIVCGAPNARAGLTTIYAPIGAYVPGLGVTLVEKPVRGVVSNGMLCSASELELSDESDGILELAADLKVGTPAAEVFGADPVIDFEVTPNRPDWLGVVGIARDLAAAGLGRFKTPAIGPVAGSFPCPIEVRLEAPQMCPAFAGRVIRGVKNGPSPEWVQQRLRAIGLRPINALVDVTNLISYDRARPLHVYDLAKLSGQTIVARAGRGSAEKGPAEASPAPHADEQLIALDGKTYDLSDQMCIIADANGERPIGLGGVMGGESTGCDEGTTDVFIESAWFDPIVTAQTGRTLGIHSDAQYRFARTVDPQSLVPGVEQATRLILEFCGGEPSQITFAGEAPAPPEGFDFEWRSVPGLAGVPVRPEMVRRVLIDLGFEVSGDNDPWRVTPPSFRRDVEGPADLVEEVARTLGYDRIQSTALPEQTVKASGVLSPAQSRVRTARRALAAMGWSEVIGWSFVSRDDARLFGGGEDDSLALANPIASDLDYMRPSALPGLMRMAGRNMARGFPDLALFEVGPVFRDDTPSGQMAVAAGLMSGQTPRHWSGKGADPLFQLKADLMALLEQMGAPVGSLQMVQGQGGPWWHPGRSARLQLGPKAVIAEFGQLHPGVLKVMDVPGPLYAFEVRLDAVPEPRRKGGKTRPAAQLPDLMPLTRDFAFVVEEGLPAGDLVRATASADKALIDQVRVFDVYQGAGVPDGKKSIALEVVIQPRERTLTDAEIEQLSGRIVAACEKLGAQLRA